MRENFERDIEAELAAKESEVIEHENVVKDIDEKLEHIDEAINSLAEDQSVLEVLDESRREHEAEKKAEDQRALILQQELENLLQQVKEVEDTSSETAIALKDLQCIGEDVSEAEEILREREVWVSLTKKKIDELIQRLGGKLMGLSSLMKGASNKGPIPNNSLPKTNQTYTHQNINGENVLVFDHPQESAKNAVYNQGSAYPEKFLGTCGLCSSATLMRKAGYSFDEKAVIEYASSTKSINGDPLCITGRDNLGENGGTNFIDRSNIIKGLTGLSVRAAVMPLDEVAQYVDKGHGAIIGVNASLYNPQWYGEYNPAQPAGHAVVLESVVRDRNTKGIIGYYVIDSNGKIAQDGCRYVPAEQLSYAYLKHGSRANITEDIIW